MAEIYVTNWIMAIRVSLAACMSQAKTAGVMGAGQAVQVVNILNHRNQMRITR